MKGETKPVSDKTAMIMAFILANDRGTPPMYGEVKNPEIRTSMNVPHEFKERMTTLAKASGLSKFDLMTAALQMFEAIMIDNKSETSVPGMMLTKILPSKVDINHAIMARAAISLFTGLMHDAIDLFDAIVETAKKEGKTPNQIFVEALKMRLGK